MRLKQSLFILEKLHYLSLCSETAKNATALVICSRADKRLGVTRVWTLKGDGNHAVSTSVPGSYGSSAWPGW